MLPLEDIRIAAIRESSRRSLKTFVQLFWTELEATTPLKWGWALDAVCNHLELVSRREITRLVINIPPGSMKSLLVSVFWPAWEWATIDPSLQFIGVAHNSQLSSRDSKKMRRLVTSNLYRKCFPEVQMIKDQNSKVNFETTSYGQRVCVAYRNMTGVRGDRVIIDDPLTVEDGMSKAALTEAGRIFNETVPTRVNDEHSAIIMIMQRIHESDPASIALNDPSYTKLIIPMRYDSSKDYSTRYFKDPRTQDGELFFPERFDEDAVRKLEARLGPYGASSQLQQTPTPRSGGYLDPTKVKVIENIEASRFTKTRGWDIAATEGAGDYTVGALVGYDAKTEVYYLLDVKRGQWNAATVDEVIKQAATADGMQATQSLPIDPGAAGKRSADQYTAMLVPYPTHTSRETGSKEARARSLSAAIHAGKFVIQNQSLVNTILDEFASFPVGQHDDIVDAISRAINHLQESNHSTFNLQGLI